jgi:Inner membrane component of T3SS, cytoplasmic domain
MNFAGQGDKIRITLADLERVSVPIDTAPRPGESYGSIHTSAAPAFVAPESNANIFRSAWCYLGAAGLLGAVMAWAICEPRFADGPGVNTWANYLLFPLMVVLMCVGFGVAEGMVEHSWIRAVKRGSLSLAIGIPLGFIFDGIANTIFRLGLSALTASGGSSPDHPSFWIVRAIAWLGFGVSGGIVYGIVGQSAKRCGYGVLGGMLGAALGGFVFDPITLALGGNSGALSRAIGMALLGVATGVAMGLVENALKDRWLYVAAGPLAGKQFVLYKSTTTIGSSNQCDLYLFKDASVIPLHAVLQLQNPVVFLRAAGPVLVNGRSVMETVLRSGDYIQISRYGFHYRDRERKNT